MKRRVQLCWKQNVQYRYFAHLRRYITPISVEEIIKPRETSVIQKDHCTCYNERLRFILLTSLVQYGTHWLYLSWLSSDRCPSTISSLLIPHINLPHRGEEARSQRFRSKVFHERKFTQFALQSEASWHFIFKATGTLLWFFFFFLDSSTFYFLLVAGLPSGANLEAKAFSN